MRSTAWCSLLLTASLAQLALGGALRRNHPAKTAHGRLTPAHAAAAAKMEAMRFAEADPAPANETKPGASRVGVPDGYDSLQRPEDRTPMVVLVDLRVMHMYDLDDTAMEAHLDLLIELTWRDSRLAYDRALLRTGQKSKRIDIASIWKPGMSILNAQRLPRVIQEDARVDPEGMVRYVRRLDAYTIAPMEVQHFPFDEHDVEVKLDSFAYDSTQILLVPTAASKTFDPAHLSNSIFEVTSWTVDSRIESSLLSDRDSIITATFHAERRPAGIFIEVIVPMAVIAVFALTAGYIGMEHLDVRIAISSTAMLTIMAFLFVVSSKLPAISYMCWVHYYTAMCFLFVFLVVVEVVFIHFMEPNPTGEEFDPRRDDFKTLSTGDFFKASLGTLVKMDSAVAIDRVARNFLPAMFAILNVILFAMEAFWPTIITTTILVVSAIVFGLAFRWCRSRIVESGFLEPKSAAEARALAEHAKQTLSGRKRRSFGDIAFVGMLDKQASDFEEAEASGIASFDWKHFGLTKRVRRARKILAFVKENPNWRDDVKPFSTKRPGAGEEKEDDDEHDDEETPLVP